MTRWREDATRDLGGQSCYLRDLGGGPIWSAGHQPIGRPAEDYEVIFAADKATYRRRDSGIDTLQDFEGDRYVRLRRIDALRARGELDETLRKVPA